MRKIVIATVLSVLWVVIEFGLFLEQTWGGHLVISANDGKYPPVHGAYKVADPPEPDTLMVLDISVMPPRVETEIEVMHGTPGTPNSVVLSPDGKHIIVKNYVDRELAFYRVAGDALKYTGVRVKVNG